MTETATDGKPQADDRRFCYGANCTWFGPIQDVGSTDYKVKPKEEHFPPSLSDTSMPCCPCCGGMLFELEEETAFWNALTTFEAGTYTNTPSAKPHPGYVEM